MRSDRSDLTRVDDRSSPTPPAGPTIDRAPRRRLDSWKEIAAYLGRSVRTVQRWEREEGLPVHRLAHEKRGSIFADRDEVDAWWESRRRRPTTARASGVSEIPAPRRLERVTDMSAVIFWPVLSSDARMLAYVSDGGRDGTTPQIWVQQIGGAAVCLTSTRREYANLSFSARDTRLVFTAMGDAGQNVYAIATLGGEPRVLKRAARDGRISPDDRWLAYISLEPPGELRIAALDAAAEQRLAPELVDISYPVWSPDGRHVLVHARGDPMSEPDYWIVPRDGGPAIETGTARNMRERKLWLVALPPAWMHDSLLFSTVGPDGINIWRQPLAPALQATGEPERLTGGSELDWCPAAAAGRVVFVSVHRDQNLWSVALEPSSGVACGPVRRITRGPGIVAHLSVTDDGRTLAYFAARRGVGSVLLRDLESGSEMVFAGEPASADKGYPTISPTGTQLAYGVRSAGPRPARPIFVANLSDGTSRMLGEDCRGRPRQWVDERILIIERFGSSRNSVALLDTTTGMQRELLVSAERSITNPRLSPDRRSITFDASRPGGSPAVFVAALSAAEPTSETEWVLVDRSASHPFWSVDGRLLYYLPTTPSTELRSVVQARRFDRASARPDGESFTVFTSNEMVVPTTKGVPGTAPIATADQIILVLADGRGDIWMMDLEHPGARASAHDAVTPLPRRHRSRTGDRAD